MRILPAFVLALGLAFAGLGCGGGAHTYDVRGTQRDPGADAHVQVERIEGGNHLLTISVRNLTPPERLGAGNTAFVVWIHQENGPVTLASRLEYQVDQRTGRATVTTPAVHFTLLITAEQNPQATQPSDFV